MASFPPLYRRELDDRQPDNGLIMASAPDGRVFGQSLYNDVYHDFRIMLPNLTEAEMNTLLQFEEDNRTLAFDYVYSVRNMPDITYECRFLNPGVKIVVNQSVIIAEAYFRGRVKP